MKRRAQWPTYAKRRGVQCSKLCVVVRVMLGAFLAVVIAGSVAALVIIAAAWIGQ